MTRSLFLVLVLAWPAAAFAYPVELDFERNGLEVVATVEQIGESAILSLTNHEAFEVRCEAVFRNGPEQSRTRQALLGPGETKPINHRPQRTVVRLRVTLWCESAQMVTPGD